MSDLSNVKAVLFDMDGLLLDSESVSVSTFLEACRQCGLSPDVEVYNRCIGVNEEGTKRILQEGYGESFPVERVWRIWHASYEAQAHAHAFPLKPGVVELLQLLEELGIRRAVVTSISRWPSQACLESRLWS